MLCISGQDVRQSVYDSLQAAASIESDTEAAASTGQVSEDNSHQPGVHGNHTAGGHDCYQGDPCAASEHALDTDSWQGPGGHLSSAHESDHSKSSRLQESRPASASHQQQAHESDHDRSSRLLQSRPASASHQQQVHESDHIGSSTALHSQPVSSASHQHQAHSHPAAVATSYASQYFGNGWDVHSPVTHGQDRFRPSNDSALALGDESQSAYTAEDYAWAQGEPGVSLTSQQQQHPWAIGPHDRAYTWDQADPHPSLDKHQHATHWSGQQSSQTSHLSSHQVRQRSSQQHGPSSAQRLPGQQSGRPPAYAQVKQGYRHRPEAQSDFQLQQGGFQSGHTSEAGALEEESSAASDAMAHQPPRKLSEVIALMSWVMPRPTPSEKLKSVGWEGEERMGPPWKHLQALNKSEKRGYGWSTDEEPDPSRAVFRHNAGEDSEVQLWRPGRTSFLFRKLDPARPGPLAATWD
ncbi:TPA: hypothetical protein ACH3X1_000096 [Trebouxia sp. C0004]